MITADTVLSQTLLSQSQAPPTVRADATASEQRATAVAFEQFFIAQMLEHMFAGISTDGPFGGGNGERIVRSMLNTEYAKIISGSGGFGIADAVQREILRLQESEPS